MKKTNKQVVRLNESQLTKIIKESLKRVLKENMDINTFKEQLQAAFENQLTDIYDDVVKDFCDGEKYGPQYFEYLIEEMAPMVAKDLTNDSMKVLQSNDWDVPQNNFRPLGFVMDREYDVHSLQDLLNKENPVEIYTDWFWSSFGTFGVKYKFQDLLTDELYELEREDGTEEQQ